LVKGHESLGPRDPLTVDVVVAVVAVRSPSLQGLAAAAAAVLVVLVVAAALLLSDCPLSDDPSGLRSPYEAHPNNSLSPVSKHL